MHFYSSWKNRGIKISSDMYAMHDVCACERERDLFPVVRVDLQVLCGIVCVFFNHCLSIISQEFHMKLIDRGIELTLLIPTHTHFTQYSRFQLSEINHTLTCL